MELVYSPISLSSVPLLILQLIEGKQGSYFLETRFSIKEKPFGFLCAGAAVTVSQSMLTQQGVPVVGLSNGKSYCFSLSLETW